MHYRAIFGPISPPLTLFIFSESFLGHTFLNFWGTSLKLTKTFSHRHLFVVCYYDGKFMRSDKLTGHSLAKHKGQPVRALAPGEIPPQPCPSWKEFEQTQGTLKHEAKT
jgi:hypothetical protein